MDMADEAALTPRWEQLPGDLLVMVYEGSGPGKRSPILRLVCRYWRQAFDSSVRRLSIKRNQPPAPPELLKFPALSSLDLSSCTFTTTGSNSLASYLEALQQLPGLREVTLSYTAMMGTAIHSPSGNKFQGAVKLHGDLLDKLACLRAVVMIYNTQLRACYRRSKTQRLPSLPESHQTASGSDHGAAESNLPTPECNHGASGSDQATSGSDHGVCGSDQAISGSNHGTSGSDQAISGSDHGASGSDEAASGSNHGMSVSDQATLGSNHGASGFDQASAGSNDDVSGFDQATAGCNRGLPPSDQATSGSNYGASSSDQDTPDCDRGTFAPKVDINVSGGAVDAGAESACAERETGGCDEKHFVERAGADSASVGKETGGCDEKPRVPDAGADSACVERETGGCDEKSFVADSKKFIVRRQAMEVLEGLDGTEAQAGFPQHPTPLSHHSSPAQECVLGAGASNADIAANGYDPRGGGAAVCMAGGRAAPCAPSGDVDTVVWQGGPNGNSDPVQMGVNIDVLDPVQKDLPHSRGTNPTTCSNSVQKDLLYSGGSNPTTCSDHVQKGQPHRRGTNPAASSSIYDQAIGWSQCSSRSFNRAAAFWQNLSRKATCGTAAASHDMKPAGSTAVCASDCSTNSASSVGGASSMVNSPGSTGGTSSTKAASSTRGASSAWGTSSTRGAAHARGASNTRDAYIARGARRARGASSKRGASSTRGASNIATSRNLDAARYGPLPADMHQQLMSELCSCSRPLHHITAPNRESSITIMTDTTHSPDSDVPSSCHSPPPARPRHSNFTPTTYSRCYSPPAGPNASALARPRVAPPAPPPAPPPLPCPTPATPAPLKLPVRAPLPYAADVKLVPFGLTKVPSAWGEFSLHTLVASHPTKAVPEELGSMSTLRQLELVGCSLKALPSSLRQLTDIHKLSLKLNAVSLEDLEIVLPCLSSLQYLDLGSNSLSEVPPCLAELSQLTTLRLTGNPLTHGFSILTHLDQLQELYLSHTATSLFPAALTKVTSLRTLELSGCGLQSIPSNISALGRLQCLNLSNNELASLPASIGSLTCLLVLSVDRNQLLCLPEALGDLSNLQDLNASSNILTELPVSISRLHSLKVLNLSRNRLKLLPVGMGSLSSMASLNLENGFSHIFRSERSLPVRVLVKLKQTNPCLTIQADHNLQYLINSS